MGRNQLQNPWKFRYPGPRKSKMFLEEQRLVSRLNAELLAFFTRPPENQEEVDGKSFYIFERSISETAEEG